MLKQMRENDFIVSKTDLKGRITYCNQIFMEMADYSEDELLGKSESIIRHPYMPKAVIIYSRKKIISSSKRNIYTNQKTFLINTETKRLFLLVFYQ